jgi:parallel beta-helix repeat protein
MKSIFLTIIALLFATQSNAAILVVSPNGSYTTATSLSSAAVRADAAGKTVVVTSPQIFSNMSTLGGWPADRTLKIEKGGSLSTTQLFRVNGPFESGVQTVFTGTGTVIFAPGSVDESRPEWFGAYSNGTNAAATTTAINRAITSFSKVKFATGGTYLVTNVVCNLSGRQLIGDNTTIKATTGVTGTVMLIAPSTSAVVHSLTNVEITGITVDSALSTGADCIGVQSTSLFKAKKIVTYGGLRGLNIQTSVLVYVDDSLFQGAGAHGLLIESFTDGIGTWAQVTRCVVTGNGYGAIFSNFPSVWVDKCIIYNNTNYGIKAVMDAGYRTSGTYTVLSDNDIDSNGADGVILVNQTKFLLSGNWVSGGRVLAANGVSLFNSRNGSVSNNSIFANGLVGLWMQGCTNILVGNNTITDNGNSGLIADTTVNLSISNNLISTTAERFLPSPQAYGVLIHSNCSGCQLLTNIITGNTVNVSNLSTYTPAISSGSGGALTNNGVPTVIFTVTTYGVYLVTVTFNADANNFGSLLLFSYASTGSSFISLKTGTAQSFTVSGDSITSTQTTGGSAITTVNSIQLQ